MVLIDYIGIFFLHFPILLTDDCNVDLPGLKTFLSFSETDTEKSKFCSIEVLDETNLIENEIKKKYVPVSMIWQNPA
jgi:hypothetical protein